MGTILFAMLAGYGFVIGVVLAVYVLRLVGVICEAIGDARLSWKRKRERKRASRSAEHCGFQRDMRSY